MGDCALIVEPELEIENFVTAEQKFLLLKWLVRPHVMM